MKKLLNNKKLLKIKMAHLNVNFIKTASISMTRQIKGDHVHEPIMS